MMKRGILCLIVPVLALSALAQGATLTVSSAVSVEMDKLETSYLAELKKLDVEEAAALAKLNDAYLKALGALDKKVRDSGTLEPLLVIRKERERFAQDKKVTPENLSTEVQEVREKQEAYLREAAQLPVDKSRRILLLAQTYDRSLAALQERLTKEEKIAAAVEVKSKRESLQERPEISAANFVVADADSKKPVESAEPKKPEKPATVAKKAPAPPKKKYEGKSENYIGRRFDKLTGLILKQDWEATTDYVDPQFVKREGTDKVEGYFRLTFPFLRLTDRPNVKLDAGKIEVDDADETATLIPEVTVNNRTHEQQMMYWIQIDGDWYLDLERGWKGNVPTPERKNPAKKKKTDAGR